MREKHGTVGSMSRGLVGLDECQQKPELTKLAEHVVEPDELDRYWSLRPPSATPEAECCGCADQPPIVLQGNLSPNPIVCLSCNGEVPPERIGFSAELAGHVAFWRDLHDALFTLWLDSSDYESWARAQLEDSKGRLTIEGLEIVRKLNGHRRAYYWWFQDPSADDFIPLSLCPRCLAGLVELFGWLVCEACSIVVSN
jgi:hypothetical protein